MKRVQITNNILLLCAIAFLIKGAQKGNIVLIACAILLAAYGMFKRRMVKKAYQESDVGSNGMDFVLSYLNKNRLHFIDMIEVYKKGKCDILYEENDGLLLYDHTSSTYFASANTLAGAKDIIYKIPTDFNVLVTHDTFLDKVIETELRYYDDLYSYNHLYDKKDKLVLAPNEIEIKKLDASYLNIVKENYSIKILNSDKYIDGCIKRGMLGAFINNELAGFIGIHDTGDMGLLEVFPKYAGRSVATYLESSLINELIDNGGEKAIYAKVVGKNKVSLHIQKKLGLVKDTEPIHYYFS